MSRQAGLVGRVAGILLLAFRSPGGATEPLPGILPGFVPPMSIHQREWLEHKGQDRESQTGSC